MTGWTTCSASTSEMEHNTASLQNAQQAATRSAETRYNTLTYKCEQEIRVRQQVMDVLKLERRFIISVAMIAAAVGALGVGLTSEAARPVAVGHVPRRQRAPSWYLHLGWNLRTPVHPRRGVATAATRGTRPHHGVLRGHAPIRPWPGAVTEPL